MKKLVLLTAVVILTTNLFASNEKFTQKMGETLAQFATCKTVDDWQGLANKFGVISNVEKEEWLPLYYRAHCYIIMSFIYGDGTEAKDGFLAEAEVAINRMLELEPNESEVYALQAFYYMAKMVVDPATRAQQYSPLIGQSIGKSLSIAPNNPRALYIQLSNEFGTAQFFGKDLTPFCQQAKKQIEQWDSYKIESPIHPVWGKEQVQEIANVCN